MANYFDQFDGTNEKPAANHFDQFDAPVPGPASEPKNNRSFLGASAEAGGRALLAAGARLVDELNPFTLSESDAATLYKDNPDRLKEITEKSATMALARYADEQTKRAREVMQQVSPNETGAVSGKQLGELEYATLDPEKAAYLSPTRVAGDVLQSLPTTLALAVSAYLTKGASTRAFATAEQEALAQGLGQLEAKAAAQQAAVKAGADKMATTGAVGEGAVGFAQQMNQAVDEARNIKPEVLAQSPKYQELLQQGYSPEAAKSLLVNQTGREAGLIAGTVDAATNLVGGRVLGKIIGEGGTLVPRVAKGFATESATEAVQSGGEQLGQNYVVQKNLDPNQDLLQGVGEQMVAGGVVGGVTGGGFSALFGGPNKPSRQREAIGDAAMAGAQNTGDAIVAASAMAGDADNILGQTVQTNLAPAANAYLGNPQQTPSDQQVFDQQAAPPSTDVGQAITSAEQQASVDIPAPGSNIPSLQQLADRNAELIAQANAATTTADRDNALAQAQVALPTPKPRVADQFADLTPMDPRQAQNRLAILREETAQDGGNALGLQIVTHPSVSGKLAIASTPLPNLDLAPAPAPSAPQVQNQLETAALEGTINQRKAEDAPRQDVIAQAMRNVEERGGVASPAEARIFQEANVGKPYDRIDTNLAPPLSTDQTLTQATGIALDRAPREQFTQEQPNNEVAADQQARRKSNIAQQTRELDQQIEATRVQPTPVNEIISALSVPEAERNQSQRVTVEQAQATVSKEDLSILERAANAPFLLGAPERTRLEELRNPTTEPVAETQQPRESTDLIGERVSTALGLPTGGSIVSTDAKFSTTREPAPGVTETVNDNGTQHQLNVVNGLANLPGMTAFLRKVAALVGKRVVFFNSETLKADGFVRKGNNKDVYINANSQMSPLAVLGHELMHLIKVDNPIAYRAIAAVVASRLDTETRAGFRRDYGPGANLEELSADLMGNAFQDPNFLSDVFTEIGNMAPEGEARGIVMRLAGAINKAVKAALTVIQTMPQNQQAFKADALVKDLTAIRAALKQALVTYAQDQKVPAMRFEMEQARAESAVNLTAGSRNEPAAPATPPTFEERRQAATQTARAAMGERQTPLQREGEALFAKQRTPAEKAAFEANKKVGQSQANKERRGVAVLASAKPGNNLATVTGRKGKDLARLHARTESILKAKPARDFLQGLGIKSYSMVTYNGSWQGEPELSFFITAKGEDGQQLNFDKTRGLGALLSWAFQQDAAIISEAVTDVSQNATDIVPAVYFGKGDGTELTAAETKKAFKAFNAINEDASVTPDGKAFEFLYFGDADGHDAHVEKLRAVAQKLQLNGESIAYNHGVLDSFQEEDENGNVTEGYTRIGRETWDSVSTAGSPGVYERATSALLVPYIIAIKAEGFGFDYARWQQVNQATRQQRQQLEQQVVAAEAANRHGLVARLRENLNISKLPSVPIEAQITQKTTNANAVQQLGVLDDLLAANPTPLASVEAYLKYEAEAFGSNNVPVAPRNLILQLADDGAGIFNQLQRLTPGQIADRESGFENGRQFRKLYEAGKVPVETTGKLMLWSFLSRGVSPYVQEAMFLDGVRGVEPFVQASAAGNFGPDMQNKYVRWAESIARQNGAASPGNGTTHNLNAFGASFLTRMSETMPDGRSKLQYLHDLFSDPNMTGPEIRREFIKIGESAGIDNKVVSFTLLVIGHTDVVVLDRVQMKNIYDDGSFANYNLYDGTYQTAIRRRLPPSTSVVDDYGISVGVQRNQITDDYGNVLDDKLMNKLSTVETYDTLEQKEGEADSAFDARVNQAIDKVSREKGVPKNQLIDERAIKPGSGLASMTTGVRGLMLYEAIENELSRVLPRVYKRLGRPQDASAGAWHWESWVVTSGQEASHGTLDALLHEVEGRANPFADVTVKQGEYGSTDYGVRYARDAQNRQYYLYDNSEGQAYRFTPAQWREYLGEVKKTFPKGFLVTMNQDRTDRTAPWFTDPRIDRAAIDALIERVGVAEPQSGGPSDITQSRVRDPQLDTPEFKAWFGNSKVVDAQGKPLVVYRGAYDVDKDGTFFSSKPQTASAYAAEEGGFVEPVYMRLANPLEVDAKGGTQMSMPYKGMNVGMTYLLKEAKKEGRDGVIVRDVADMVEDNGTTDYYVSLGKKAQVKSAIGNNGEFSSNNPDITASRVRNPQENTAQFKAWFKNSKVVDAQGKPLVVYHGTRPGNVISEFESRGKSDGIYFTPDPQYAEGFTEDLFDNSGAKGAIYPVYLSIRNPYVVRTANIQSEEAQNFLYRGLDRSKLEKQGYDGAMLYVGGELDQVMAFNAKQIKSAIGNNGAFSTNNSDITASPVRNIQEGTPEFAAWFGNSKVVNPDGSPTVMYHATHKSFDTFAKSFRGAIFVTPSVEFANEYISEKANEDEENSTNLMPLYVKAENIFDYENASHVEQAIAYLNKTGLFRGVQPGYFEGGRWDSIEDRNVQRAIKALGFDSFYVEEGGVKNLGVYNSNQVKSAIGNNGEFNTNNPDITKSSQRIVGESRRQYTPEQLAYFQNVGRTVTVPSLKEKLQALRKDLGKNLTQGLADPFSPLKDLDFKSYMLARLSKGASGAFESLLKFGKLSLRDGAYDSDQSGGFLKRVGEPLHGEIEDFLWWVAANRAERLSKEDRENLFTAKDIAAGKSLASGTTDYDYVMQHNVGPARAGTTTRDRSMIFKDALKTFDEFNKNALDMAEQSGLIDKDSRAVWEHEFYVPFYRASEEDGSITGANVKDGLIRQQAFKQLKGGSEKLNSDLLANTLSNWAHLLDASSKNRAGLSVAEAASKIGAAIEAPEATVRDIAKSMGLTKNVLWVMDQGTKRFFIVQDPHIMASLSAISFTGFNDVFTKAMGAFKNVFTIGVTASPPYKIKNLVRDSVQAVATAPLSYNIAKNVMQGARAADVTGAAVNLGRAAIGMRTKELNVSQDYVSALASGGLIRFGNMLEGNNAERVRMLIDRGVDDSSILDSEDKLKALGDRAKVAWDAYNELGSRGEEINRVSLYKQLVDKGVSHAEAGYMARDLMDFGLQGTYSWVRFLTQVVPFMNARIQGLYKLGTAANEDKARFSIVLAAVAMASIALMLAYEDDDDWKKREDWDRNNNWWFKFGGKAYRIPKPFEIGAIATLAERGLEYFISPEMTGRRLGHNVKSIILDNLSMNPMPQLSKPIYEIYANKSDFTGRAIESLGMERLKSEYRFTANTSMTARALSTATLGAMSPVQYEHMIQGYFGWLGSMAVGAADMALRPLTGQPGRPTADYFKLASGNLVSDVNSGTSRYVTQMYDQATLMEQAYNTYKLLLKEGKGQEAKEFFAANKADIIGSPGATRVKAAEAKFNEMIRMVERSKLDPDVKRERIQMLKNQKDKVARIVAPGYKKSAVALP